MSFLVAFSLIIGIGASGLSIYEFLNKKKASGTLYVVVAVVMILAAILISNIPTPSGSGASGNNQLDNTSTSTLNPQKGTTVATVPPTSPTIAPTQNSIPTSTPTSEYSAAQPGPHCDTKGGIWTVQGLNQIQCANGTEISSNYNSLGYLYLQLPDNATFSPNNKLSIMGSNLSYITGPVCLGLAEQGTSIGILGEFCGDGKWFIYSLSSTGVITQTPLNQGITATRSSEEISLTLQGNTVLFSIDTEIYKTTASSIHPVKVGITSFNETPNNYNYIAVTNFSYMATN